MSKSLVVFPARLGADVMAKANVAGYTRKDGVFVKDHDSGKTAKKPKARSSSKGGVPVTKTENEGWGFHGEAMSRHVTDNHGPDVDRYASQEIHSAALAHAGKKFSEAAHSLVQNGHFDTHEQARDFLDSRYGRHSHDELGPDGDINKNRWLSHYVKLHKKEAGIDSTAKAGSTKPASSSKPKAASGNKMHEYYETPGVWEQQVKNQRGIEAAAFHIGYGHGNDDVRSTYGHSDDRYKYTAPTSSHLGDLKKHYDAGKKAGTEAAKKFGDAGGISRDAFRKHMGIKPIDGSWG